jgi:putative ABC transport system ATP-binding protein
MEGFEVRVEDVSKTYRSDTAVTVTALDRVTFAVPSGQVAAVMGPSGSGKSTLLHVVGAMDDPDEGRILVGDREVTGLSRKEQAAYRRTIGFVFQRFHLLPALTALDNVIAPVLPFRVDFEKEARALELLRWVGLEGRARSLPSELSGGEQQRVAIARALINDPGLLLADEPTGNLDSETSIEIVNLLLALRRERGMTIILATHDPLVASRCDRILRLQDGRVVDDVDLSDAESPDEVLDRINRPGPGE